MTKNIDAGNALWMFANIKTVHRDQGQNSSLFGKSDALGIDFQSFINADPLNPSGDNPVLDRAFTMSTTCIIPQADTDKAVTSRPSVIKQKGLNKYDQLSDWEKYKDDQLLGNPGGDYYYAEQKMINPHPAEQESFWGRIEKDLSDASGQCKELL